jgi:uncharacterized membrane protein
VPHTGHCLRVSHGSGEPEEGTIWRCPFLLRQKGDKEMKRRLIGIVFLIVFAVLFVLFSVSTKEELSGDTPNLILPPPENETGMVKVILTARWWVEIGWAVLLGTGVIVSVVVGLIKFSRDTITMTMTSMASENRLQIRTIIIGVILVPLTAISIYFIYGDYIFHKLPSIRFSIEMSLLTCLWTYAYCFFSEGINDTPTVVFMMTVIPFELLLMIIPDIPEGGGESKSASHLLTFIIILAVVHGLGFYLIKREIQKYRISSEPR